MAESNRSRWVIIWRSLICASTLGMCMPAMAVADSARFHIAAQPLSVALKTFADQANMELLYKYDDVSGIKGNAVSGELEKHTALERLLRHTGLEAVYTAPNAATIRSTRAIGTSSSKSSHATQNQGRKEGKKTSSSGFRLAQMDQEAHGTLAAVGPTVEQPSNTAGTLEEVVVTAQKREQRAFDVPISLVVLTAKDFERNQITSLNDLQYYVPGLWVEGNGPERRITIDGISNAYGTGSLVGVYIDDADATSDGFVGNYGYGQLDTRTYDMARVEVLRGPQGTLYGEGSMGGALHFVTNKPVLDQFQMTSQLATELTQDGAPSQRIDMMMNTPLVANTLGLRIAGEFEHQGGWIDEPVANVKNFNDQNLVDVRVEGSWQPTRDFKVNLMQIEHRNAYGIGDSEDANGNYTPPLNQTTIPNGQQDYELSNATLTYDFRRAQLLSSTTRINYNNNSVNWQEVLPIGGTTYQVYFPYFLNNENSVSEELRLSGTGGGPWQWTVGYFYKDFKDLGNEAYYFGTQPLPGTPLSSIPYFSGAAIGEPDGDRERAWSAFADTSYRLFERLTIGAGLRYFTDDAQFIEQSALPQSKNFLSTDPRIYVRYGVTDGINVYASAAKGFREGGFNSEGQPPYQPESVWTYNLGTKMRLLQGRVSIDSDVYLSNYENYDILGLTAAVPVNITSNGGTARIKGINADLQWRPSGQWRFGFTGNYVGSKFVNISARDAAFDVGDPLPFIPEYLLTESTERDFQWLSKPAFLHVEYSQMGRAVYINRQLQIFGSSPVLHLLNLNTGMQWSDALRFSLYVQNLLNDRGYLDPSYVTGVTPRERPRTVGFAFSVSFQ